MQYTALISLLLSGALAAPLVADNSNQLQTRQFGGGRNTETDVEDGKCSDVTLIFARGSTEGGNIGSSVGPPTCSQLKRRFNSVSCQGVGGPYDAQILTNNLRRGTTPAAIQEGVRLFEKAASDCPNTIMVGGGYSQGAALMTGAVQDTPADVKARIAGAVLYGNTQNRQNNGKIPDYPEDDALTFCNTSDGVCGGALLVTAGHLTYTADVGDAVDFLEDRINAAQSSGAGASAGEDGEAAADEGSDDSGSSFGNFGSWFGN
ncbi:hypothetical protein MBLNU230_g2724t1 [Neophaeotheca triangularis]